MKLESVHIFIQSPFLSPEVKGCPRWSSGRDTLMRWQMTFRTCILGAPPSPPKPRGESLPCLSRAEKFETQKRPGVSSITPVFGKVEMPSSFLPWPWRLLGWMHSTLLVSESEWNGMIGGILHWRNFLIFFFLLYTTDYSCFLGSIWILVSSSHSICRSPIPALHPPKAFASLRHPEVISGWTKLNIL